MRIVEGGGDGSAAAPAVLAAAVAAVRAYMVAQADSTYTPPTGQITAWRFALRAAESARRGWRQVDRNPTTYT